MKKANISAKDLVDLPEVTRGPVFEFLLNSRKVFVLAVMLTFFWEVLSLAPIIYMMNLLDRVMTSRSETTLVSLTLILVVALVFSASLDWLRRRLLMRLSLRFDWDMSSDVFNAAFQRFVGHKRLNVQQIMGDLKTVGNFFQGNNFFTLVEAPFGLLFVGVLYLIAPSLALFAVVSIVLMSIMALIKARATTPLLRYANQVAAETNRSVAEVLRHSETALALGMKSTIRRNWYQQHQADLLVRSNGQEASGLLGAAANLISGAMPMLTKGFAVYLAINGEISVGMVIASMFLVRKATAPLQGVVNQWPQFVNAKMSYERLEALLQDFDADGNQIQLPVAKGVLEVDHLSVTSPKGKRKLLSDIQFSLQPGQMLAVVGPSAAGKSTLCRQLVGINAPSEGEVRLDGAAVFDWIRSDHGPHMGYVPQDILVLEGTVAQNIARMQEVDSDAVIRAAELIDLHQTILGFPEGYETVLGQDGHVLTGGQKQRLIIARALYKDPKFMVLDEPSSSLDAEAEQALLRLIRILKRNQVSVVLTTHRHNLLALADLVLVLDNGRQKAFGTFKDIGQTIFHDMDAPRQSQIKPSNRPPNKALGGGGAAVPSSGGRV